MKVDFIASGNIGEWERRIGLVFGPILDSKRMVDIYIYTY